MESLTPITSDFIKSWDEMERFYSELTKNEGWEYVEPIKDVLGHLRSLGYDHLLRLGKSVYIMHIQRTKTWQLKPGQHAIVIEPTLENVFKVRYVGDNGTSIRIETDDLINSKEFNELLAQLIKQPIN
jgi:hypothetical protein